jgi:hypothetical protein
MYRLWHVFSVLLFLVSPTMLLSAATGVPLYSLKRGITDSIKIY